MPLTTTRTQAQLKEEVGRILHVLGVGEQALSAEDDAVIGDKMVEILSELSREGLIMFDITDVDAVDIASFRSLAEIIAASLVNVFEVPPNESQRLLILGNQARDRLKRMIFDGFDDDTVETEYF